NEYYYTPLIFACQKGNEKLVKILIDLGADITKKEYIKCTSSSVYDMGHGSRNYIKKYLNTPLYNACINGNLNIFKYLIEHGSDINKEDWHDKPPLFIACENGNIDFVYYLVKKLGVDINKENNKGETPIFVAYENGHENIVKYLTEHEHSVDINK
ncbi:ankyrin, partial [Anaeromyces robustus]